jgi:acetylornithine/N-succinyldiaminopimelate aminotransferase
MNSWGIINTADEFVLPTYARYKYAFVRGEGSTLYDAEGKPYVDLASGIGVNSLGYYHRKWVDAVAQQAAKLQHVSNLYYTQPMAELAQKLVTRTGMKYAFFSNSGAESNEGLIKLARKYSFEGYGTHDRHKIVTLQNSFHGRTVTTLEATGQEKFHGFDFFPYTGGFTYIWPGDIGALRSSSAKACAVLLELVQGEGGVYPLPREYVREVEAFCREHDFQLLIAEVQTGIGRTGTLFAYQQYGIEPDAVSFAKGIAGGLPMGGFLVNERAANVLRAGDHATTFGGNPICAAAANVVLDELTDSMLADVVRKGQKIKDAVTSFHSSKVAEVRGLGLMIGVKLIGITHREAVEQLLERGVVALTAGGDTLRFLPPLTITDAELDTAIAALKEVLT